MQAGRRGRRGRAARRAVPKDTAHAGEPAPDQRGRAPPWRAVAHPWSTRTVTSRRVQVSKISIINFNQHVFAV